jgi:AraC-like DNA-binding protein
MQRTDSRELESSILSSSRPLLHGAVDLEMRVAAFLPALRAKKVSQLIPGDQLIVAKSWEDLERSLEYEPTYLVLIDPTADGRMNLSAATTLLSRYPTVRIVAYVGCTPGQLKAVTHLSEHGLAGVLLSPRDDDGLRLRQLMERLPGHRLAYQWLGFVESRLGMFEPQLFRAAQDLFERPHRYESAADLSRASNLSTRTVYRAFEKAELGTPGKLVTVAKVLRGYVHLSQGESVKTTSAKIGYASPRVFAERFSEIVGSPPSHAKRRCDLEELFVLLLEWLYKPSGQRRKEDVGEELDRGREGDAPTSGVREHFCSR